MDEWTNIKEKFSGLNARFQNINEQLKIPAIFEIKVRKIHCGSLHLDC